MANQKRTRKDFESCALRARSGMQIAPPPQGFIGMISGCGFSVPKEPVTIARSFNCGRLPVDVLSLVGAAENVRIKTTNGIGQLSIRWSRRDELRVRLSNLQLKLRAIVKSASGTPTMNDPLFGIALLARP
jgi:hypothetical protein